MAKRYRVVVQPHTNEKKWVATPEWNQAIEGYPELWRKYARLYSPGNISFVSRNKEKAVARAEKYLRQVKVYEDEEQAARIAAVQRLTRQEIREVK